MKEAKKTKIGYKVVKKENGRFCSYTGIIEWLSLDGCVEYTLGKTARPKDGSGPLCVFRTLDQARSLCDVSFGAAILKVRYVPSKQKSIWVRDSMHLSLGELREGTVLADSVTPIKEMVIE